LIYSFCTNTLEEMVLKCIFICACAANYMILASILESPALIEVLLYVLNEKS